MFLRITEFVKRFPATIRGMWVVTIVLFTLGGGLNKLVIEANNGMPVPITAEGFFVIYPHYYWVALEMTPDRMLIAGKAKEYVVMTENSRLKALAARFYFVSPINIWQSLPVWLTVQFSRSDILLLGQEMQMSIGDIIIQIADILILLATLATTVFMFFQGFKYQPNKACGGNNL